jgi:hypothetical protein
MRFRDRYRCLCGTEWNNGQLRVKTVVLSATLNALQLRAKTSAIGMGGS